MELRSLDVEIVEEQQVDVEGTRAEAGSAHSAGGELERLGQSQELPGIQTRFGKQSRVEIGRLGDGGDGAGTEERRDAQDSQVLLQPFDCGSECGFRVAEISTQGQRYPVRVVLRLNRRPHRHREPDRGPAPLMALTR
jgi:hypothetical protein